LKPDRQPLIADNPELCAALTSVMDAIILADPDNPEGAWSSYYHGSKRAGQAGRGRFRGNYWTTPCELFARAFEAYVFDWLKERGRRNDYLVHGVGAEQFADTSKYRGNPYPVGEERQRINAAMAKLIEAWRTTINQPKET
jgi:hypothetical protein